MQKRSHVEADTAGGFFLVRGRECPFVAEIVPVWQRAIGGKDARVDESGVVVFEQNWGVGAVLCSPAEVELPEFVDAGGVDVVPGDGWSAPVCCRPV